MLSSVAPKMPRNVSRHKNKMLNRQVRNLRQSTSSSRTSNLSQSTLESSAPKHNWVRTRQVNIIINRLSEFISSLNISRNSINDINQYLENLRHLVSEENSHRQSLSSMTIDFWKTWNDFSINLNTALNTDETPRILAFIKEQFNSAESTIRKIQAKINPSNIDPEQKLQQIYDKFSSIQQIESFENIDNLTDIILDAKKIYSFVKQNNKRLFTSQIESDYAINSIERGIQSLSFISNDDNLRDELVNQYRSAYNSLKKLVPESNIKVRGKSVPNENQPNTSSILAPQAANKTSNNTKVAKQKTDGAAKKKKRPKLPVFDDVPITTNDPSKQSKKRSVTPPSARHHRSSRQSAMIPTASNNDAISMATTATSSVIGSVIASNQPKKLRSNSDYILEMQKTQIQKKRRHRNNEPTDYTNAIASSNIVYTMPNQVEDEITNQNANVSNKNNNNNENKQNGQHHRGRRRRWNIIKEEDKPQQVKTYTFQLPPEKQQDADQKEKVNDQQQKENEQTKKEENNQSQKSAPSSPKPVADQSSSSSSFVSEDGFESFVDATDVKHYVFEMPAPLEENQNVVMLSPSEVFGDDEGECDSMSIRFSTTSEIAKKKKKGLSQQANSPQKQQQEQQANSPQKQQQQQTPPPAQEHHESSSRHRHSKHSETEKQQEQPKPQPQPKQQQPQPAQESSSTSSRRRRSHKNANQPAQPAPAAKQAPAPTPAATKPAPTPAPAATKPAPAPAPAAASKPAAQPAAIPKSATTVPQKPPAQAAKDDEYYDDDYYDEEEDYYYDD